MLPDRQCISFTMIKYPHKEMPKFYLNTSLLYLFDFQESLIANESLSILFNKSKKAVHQG